MAKETKAVAVAAAQDVLTQQKALEIRAEAQQRAVALQELGVDAKDLVIPLIQVMQNTSALVGDEKARLGDVVNMQTEEVLPGPVRLLPLKLYKTLRTYDVTNNGFKFMHEEPLNAQNDKLQGEGMLNGVPVKRYQTLNFFVLLKSDLDKGEGFPCLVRFRSTGMNAGRALATHLYKLVFFNKKPYSMLVELSTKKEKKDTAVYAVPMIAKGAAASPAEMQEAENWLAMLAAGNYRLDDREEVETDAAAGAAQPVVVGSEVVGSAQGEY